MAQTKAHIPKYAPLSANGTKSVNVTSTSVINPPPPIPWIALEATSMAIDMLREHKMEPIKKTMIAASRV
jgi:hypothetical protein